MTESYYQSHAPVTVLPGSSDRTAMTEFFKDLLSLGKYLSLKNIIFEDPQSYILGVPGIGTDGI